MRKAPAMHLTTNHPAEIAIDWISVTLPSDCKYNTRPPSLNNRYEDGRGLHGYTVTRRYEDGSIMATNPDRPEMGIHWIYPGSALASAYDHGMSAYDIMQFYALRGGRFTRLDIAADLRETGAQVEQFVQAFKEQKCITSLKSARRIENLSERGGTLYLGGKTSKRSMRIYDKGAETGTLEDWIRAELQTREDVAHGAAMSLLAAGFNWVDQAARYIAGVVSWSADSAVGRMWAILIEITGQRIEARGQAKSPNTIGWLLKSVAPSIARLITQGTPGIWDALGDVVAANMAKQRDRIQTTPA